MFDFIKNKVRLTRIKKKDGSKAKAFLNFIKRLDFITVNVNEVDLPYPTLTEEEIIDRVGLTNNQIREGKTVSQDDLEEESKTW